MSEPRLYKPTYIAAWALLPVGLTLYFVTKKLPLLFGFGVLIFVLLGLSFLIGYLQSSRGESIPKRDLPIYEVDGDPEIPVFGPLAAKIQLNANAQQSADTVLDKKAARAAAKEEKKRRAAEAKFQKQAMKEAAKARKQGLTITPEPEEIAASYVTEENFVVEDGASPFAPAAESSDTYRGSVDDDFLTEIDEGFDGDPEWMNANLNEPDLAAYLKPDFDSDRPSLTVEPPVAESAEKKSVSSGVDSTGWLHDLYTNPDFDLSSIPVPTPPVPTETGDIGEVMEQGSEGAPASFDVPEEEVVDVSSVSAFAPEYRSTTRPDEEESLPVDEAEEVSVAKIDAAPVSNEVSKEESKSPVEEGWEPSGAPVATAVDEDQVESVDPAGYAEETEIVVSDEAPENGSETFSAEAEEEVATDEALLEIVDTEEVTTDHEIETNDTDVIRDDVSADYDDDVPRLAAPGTYPLEEDENENEEGNTEMATQETRKPVAAARAAAADLDIVSASDEAYPVLVSDSKVASIASQIALLVAEAEIAAQKIADERVAMVRAEAEETIRQVREEADRAVELARKDKEREAKRADEKLENARKAAQAERDALSARYEDELSRKVDASELDALNKEKERIAENLDEAERNLSRVVEAQKTVADAAATSSRLQAVSRLRKIREQVADKDGNDALLEAIDSYIDEFRIS